MNKDQKREITLAKKELEYFNIIVEEIGNNDWDNCLKELTNRGVSINDDTYEENKNRKQVDCFGTFVAFTLIQVKDKVEIGYSWTIGDINFELYLNKKGRAVLIC